jgi:glycosyltransferase involved in cell wall biosynthesis
MKKKIKVWLQYPWKFPDSPYYKYLIDDPPENVEYLNVKKQKGVITNKKRLGLSNFLKRIIRELIKKMRIPLVNAHETKQKKGYDLIHCAHCLSKNNFPWVADVESLWQLYVSGQKTKAATKNIRRILSGKNCKRIILWTKRTEREFNETFPEIKNKTTIIYPALPLPKSHRKKHKGINLLFVGRSFYEKGGLDAVRAIDFLTKKYNNVRAVVISEIPKEILEKYSANKKINFFGLMPKEELEKIYSNTDIFIYPGYTDTFGFGILECMSWGIPVISVEGAIKKDSKKELIQNGITGFLINKPETLKLGKIKFVWKQAISLSEIERKENPEIINGMIEKAEELIKNKKLREKMSKNCPDEIKNGKFSIKERNRKLKKIYEEALSRNF